MPYEYHIEKKQLFTDEGQRMFLKIRDHTMCLLRQAGAVRLQEAISQCTGDTWQMIACLDRMVELGELVELSDDDVPGQYRVFIAA